MSGRAIARIDLGAISGNCSRLAGVLQGGSELCAVVKADAYGHGMPECSWAALEGGAARLAVATALEADQLGRLHPDVSLLTLGDLRGEDMDLALAAGSEVTVWTDRGVELAAARARAMRLRGRVHVKMDSGMGRLGNRDAREVVRLADAVARDPDLELAGVWTHFATADDAESDYFYEQLSAFEAVATAVRSAHPGVAVHAANSAATLREPRSHFDFVRCGIAVYGLDPMNIDAAARGLHPVLSLRSYLADVKWLEEGATVGYSRTWSAPRGTWIGVAPIGYGDGVRRALSNNADLLVGGRRRPVVGNVSMDNVTVDLGPRTDAQPGDEVVVIGAQGREAIPAEEVAARLGTINYEVTTGLTQRVVRRFHGK